MSAKVIPFKLKGAGAARVATAMFQAIVSFGWAWDIKTKRLKDDTETKFVVSYHNKDYEVSVRKVEL